MHPRLHVQFSLCGRMALCHIIVLGGIHGCSSTCQTATGGYIVRAKLVDGETGEGLPDGLLGISLFGQDGQVGEPASADILSGGNFSDTLVVTDTAEFCFSDLEILGSVGGVLFATPPGLLDTAPAVSQAILTVTREGGQSEVVVDITEEMISCRENDSTCVLDLGTLTVMAAQ